MKCDLMPRVGLWFLVGGFAASIASCSSTHSNSVSPGGAGAPPDASGGTSSTTSSGNTLDGGTSSGSTAGDAGTASGGNAGDPGATATGTTGGGGGATTCADNGDCADLLDTPVCMFGVCSSQCAGDRECPEGQRCLLTESDAACVTPETASCQDEGQCPAGSLCLDGVCRTHCADDEDICLANQQCSRLDVCWGTEPDHDVPEPDPSGTPCEEEGEIECARVASVARLICQDGYWLTHEACEEGEICVPSGAERGSCRTVPEDCVGRAPNDSFCDGATRKTCSASLLEVETEECASVQHCNLGQGPDCALCLPNTFECEGDILKTCKNDGSGYTETDCALEGEPCSRTAGACTEDVCSDGQRRCTDDDVLEECNETRTGFVTVSECDVGLCDSQSLECDECITGNSSCSGGQKLECSPDGQTETLDDCPVSTPYCIGAGNCVQCTQASHCPAVGECATRTCDNNTCTPIPVDVNTPCSGGVCDGAGNCVECVSPAQCGADTECANPTCNDNECDVQNEPDDTDCSGGVCNGSGACVECTSPSHCSASGQCHTATCSAGSCGESPKDSGEACTGGYCNGSGSCVECTSDSHCGGATPVCLNGACVQCSPAGADICASSCSRQTRSCSSTGTWQNDTLCAGDAYCSDGACVTDTLTVGRDQASGSTATMGGLILAQKFEVSCASAVQYLGAQFSSGSGLAVMAIYDHDSANDAPGSIRTWTTGASIPAGGAFAREPTVPGAVLPAGTYWIAIQASSGAAMFHTSSGSGVSTPGNFDLSMPSTYPSSPSVSSGNFSLYAVVRPAP